MPELPEVETTIRMLSPQMLEQAIVNFRSTNLGESQLSHTEDYFQNILTGKKLKSLNRHGKWMLFDFGDIKAVGHLRMSGRFQIAQEMVIHPHNRFHFELKNGTVINYLDQRRFGTFDLLEDFSLHKGLSRLGPDALDTEKSTSEHLYTQLQRRSAIIYSTLLNQSVIAGLGNIYVNEILYSTKIHPLQPANTIFKQQAEEIISEMTRILNQALELKGTTLIDNLYQDPEGKTGEFAQMLNVYGKKNDPEIEVLKVGGRSVFVHKKEQKLSV